MELEKNITFKINATLTIGSINYITELNISKPTNPTNLFKTKCDIISPCALGGAINSASIKQLNCQAIVGAANNQLENQEIGEWLFKNNIIYSLFSSIAHRRR